MIPYQMNKQQGWKLLTTEFRIWATSASENCYSVHFCNGLRRYMLITNKFFKTKQNNLHDDHSSLNYEKYVIKAHKNFIVFLFFSYRYV